MREMVIRVTCDRCPAVAYVEVTEYDWTGGAEDSGELPAGWSKRPVVASDPQTLCPDCAKHL